MAASRLPKPPTGTGTAGARLWKRILGDLGPGWELDERERHLLERACRCADEIARLEETVDREGLTVCGSRGQTVIHPAMQEVRQLRLVELRLLRELELVDPAAAKDAASPAGRRARRAAELRWLREAR